MTWHPWVFLATMYAFPAVLMWLSSKGMYHGGADRETRTAGARGMLLAPVWPLGILVLVGWLTRLMWIEWRRWVHTSEIRKRKRREFWEAVRGTTRGR